MKVGHLSSTPQKTGSHITQYQETPSKKNGVAKYYAIKHGTLYISASHYTDKSEQAIITETSCFVQIVFSPAFNLAIVQHYLRGQFGGSLVKEAKGLSLVWLFMCSVRCPLCGNPFPHRPHSYGFSPVCVRI